MSNDIQRSGEIDYDSITSRMEPRSGPSAERCRRHIVTLLRDRERPTSREDLASRVAAWKHGKPPREVSTEERRRTLVSLYHVHLPALEEAGLLRRTADGGIAIADAPRPEASALEPADSPSHPFRRALLGVLDGLGDDAFPLPVAAAAEAVVEAGTPSPDGRSSDVDRVVVALHHLHLPKLAAAGLVSYDPDEMTIGY